MLLKSVWKREYRNWKILIFSEVQVAIEAVAYYRGDLKFKTPTNSDHS